MFYVIRIADEWLLCGLNSCKLLSFDATSWKFKHDLTSCYIAWRQRFSCATSQAAHRRSTLIKDGISRVVEQQASHCKALLLSPTECLRPVLHLIPPLAPAQYGHSTVLIGTRHSLRLIGTRRCSRHSLRLIGPGMLKADAGYFG